MFGVLVAGGLLKFLCSGQFTRPFIPSAGFDVGVAQRVMETRVIGFSDNRLRRIGNCLFRVALANVGGLILELFGRVKLSL